MTRMSRIDLNDFRCMRQGKQLHVIGPEDAALLSAVSKALSPFKRRALLLIHGFSSSPAVYRNLIGLFKGYDAIVAPVLPGHASNVDDFAQTKAADWLAFIDDFYQKLSQEYALIDVMGLSLGGLLACHLSARYPLNHLYLLAPALVLPGPVSPMLILAKALSKLGFRMLRNHAGDLYTNDHCEIAYRQLPLSIISEILSFIHSFEFVLPQCPTEVFLGRFDKVVDSAAVAALFREKPHVHIHWLERSAHVLPLDGDQERIIDLVNQQAAKEQAG